MPSVAIDNVNIVATLKKLYPQERVENMVYEDHTLLAMLQKKENAWFGGADVNLTVRYADTQGRSRQFATAQANIGSFGAKRFTLTRAKDYQLIALDTETIMATRSNKGALISALDTEVSSGLNNISKSLAVSLYRGRAGDIGQLLSDPGTGTTFTLSNINDVTSFEVGMYIVFAPARSGGALRAGGRRLISAVNRDTGVITVSAALDAALDAGDYIFAEGDHDDTTSGLKCSGLLDWFPSTTPSPSESFFGVDRSVDPTRLAGLRIDVSALNPEEGLVTVLSRLCREGGKPSHVFYNHIDHRNVEVALGAKAETEYQSVGDIGFSSLRVRGPKGDVKIFADQDCPAGRGFFLDMRTLKLYSLGKVPFIQDLDGNQLSRVYNADSWESRIIYFAQLGCTAPGFNANATLPGSEL